MPDSVEIVALSDVGCVRENNEDSFYVDSQRGFVILADGMGGHKAGEVASQLAVSTLAAELSEVDRTAHPKRYLEHGLAAANRAVYESALTNLSQFGMGTTIVVTVISDNQAHIAHVGDSRIYLYRNNKLSQLTEDHTYRAQIARYSPEEFDLVENDLLGKMLVRAIGIEESVMVDQDVVDLEAGDCLLLCSDGLTDMLCDNEISTILHSETTLESTAKKLIRQANKKGGPDNISVILIRPGIRV